MKKIEKLAQKLMRETYITKASIIHDGNIDITVVAHVTNALNLIHIKYPMIRLLRAYNGLSGDSFEYEYDVDQDKVS